MVPEDVREEAEKLKKELYGYQLKKHLHMNFINIGEILKMKV